MQSSINKTTIKLSGAIKVLCALACTFFILLIILLLLTIETSPVQSIDNAFSDIEAKTASVFIKRVSKQIINSRQTVTIHASQDELNSAMKLVNNAYPGLTGKVDVAQKDAEFYLSIRFPVFSKDFYINSRAQLISAADGIHWKNGRLGKISLNKTFSDYFFHRFIEIMLGRNYGRDLLKGVTAVEINGQTLQFDFTPAKSFHVGFADAVKRFTAYSGESVAFDTARVQHYVDYLVDLTRSLPKQNISLSYYLHKVLNEAKQRCADDETMTREENTAAIYALAIVVAPGTFRHFVSDLKVNRLNATNQPVLTIAGRQDLAKHFVYSAALKILSNRGISFSLGEMKELIDSASGGSGFSFADIAADKSGIKFAEFAAGEHKNAVLLQHRVSQSLKETDFFPPVAHLPEGLNQHEFKAQYSSTQSMRYQTLVTQIDNEIDTVALYR